MTQFHDTGYGRRFFDAQLPELIRAINSIAERLINMEGSATAPPDLRSLAGRLKDCIDLGSLVIYTDDSAAADIQEDAENALDAFLEWEGWEHDDA